MEQHILRFCAFFSETKQKSNTYKKGKMEENVKINLEKFRTK
jgi:hypothetical protein